jgi:hypothetical protein
MNRHPVEDYLAELATTLRGPAARRAELLTETRDSLHDTAEARLRPGRTEQWAQEQAVGEFGPIHRIAAEYQAELSVAHGLNTLRILLFAVPACPLLREVLSSYLVPDGRGKIPGWYDTIATLVDFGTLGLLVTIASALLSRRWISRCITDTRRLGTWMVRFAAGAVAFLVLAQASTLFATVEANITGLSRDPAFLVAGAGTIGIAALLAARVRRGVTLLPRSPLNRP